MHIRFVGTIPDVGDDIVYKTMCVVSSFECCASTLTIQVKNCGDYRVYKLVQTNGCPQGYCFGNCIKSFVIVYDIL